MNDIIRIGTRKSALALIQTQLVADELRQVCPGIQVEIVTKDTLGDRILDKPLQEFGGKGVFVSEFEQAIQEGVIDLAVHSAKDLPMELAQGLTIAAVSGREDPRDVLVLPQGVHTLDKTKPIGCSSLRRILQLKELYPDMECKSVRGNVQTRLKKLDSGEYSALILAAAGLKRLGLEARISRYFQPEEMIPAAGQGILAVQGRAGEPGDYLKEFSDLEGFYAAVAERAFVRHLDGGCSSPVAAHAVVREKEIVLRGLYYDEETGKYEKGMITGPAEEGETLGISLAQKLRDTCKNQE